MPSEMSQERYFHVPRSRRLIGGNAISPLFAGVVSLSAIEDVFVVDRHDPYHPKVVHYQAVLRPGAVYYNLLDRII